MDACMPKLREELLVGQCRCFYFSCCHCDDYSSYSSCYVVKFMVRTRNEGKEGQCKEEEPLTLKK